MHTTNDPTFQPIASPRPVRAVNVLAGLGQRVGFRPPVPDPQRLITAAQRGMRLDDFGRLALRDQLRRLLMSR